MRAPVPLPPEGKHAPAGRTRSAAGFTLLEMIVVVVLLSISLALFLGYNFSQRERLRLKTSAREVFTFFQTARSYALVDGLANPCLYLPANKTVSESLHGKTVLLPEGVEVVLEEELPEQNQTVTLTVFYPDGSALGGKVVLAGGGRSLILTVDPFLGDVSIEEQDDQQE